MLSADSCREMFLSADIETSKAITIIKYQAAINLRTYVELTIKWTFPQRWNFSLFL